MNCPRCRTALDAAKDACPRLGGALLCWRCGWEEKLGVPVDPLDRLVFPDDGAAKPALRCWFRATLPQIDVALSQGERRAIADYLWQRYGAPDRDDYANVPGSWRMGGE